MKRFIILAGAVVVLAIVGYIVFTNLPESEQQIIGGTRDKEGCLTAAGYSFDSVIHACARSFELTPDIREAARLAVAYAGEGYALTVVSFNSYEEAGAYDMTLERGTERTREEVYVRGGKAGKIKRVSFFCDGGKGIGATFYIGYDKYVDLTLSDGRTLSVPRAISASGARYASPDESFVFWNKGETAFITEGKSVTTTYGNCLIRE